jgi:hypothetical protein
MRAHLFCLLGLLAVNVLPLFAVQAVFHSDGPFTARCDSTGGLLSDGTLVFIFEDWDRDGPDSSDWVFPAPVIIPEENPHASFYSFVLNAQGGFNSSVWRYSGGTEPGIDIALYLRIFYGDSFDSCYTSTVTILPLDGATHQLDFPFDSWVCGSAPCQIPSCETYEVFLDYSDSTTISSCFYVCPMNSCRIDVFLRPGASMMRPPIIQVLRGCDSLLSSCAGVIVDAGSWYTFLDNWFSGSFRAQLWGRVTFSSLDSIPCGTLDTLTAENRTEGINLHWNTTRETDLDSFELWRVYSGTGCAGVIPASDNPSGNQYDFLDTGVSYVGAYGYNLVMVGNDGNKYAAAHIRVVRHVPTVATDLSIPCTFRLHPNYPNPFNPSTTITFDLPQTTRATVRVYDIAGREVALLSDDVFSAGTHSVSFYGSRLPSGIYFCRINAGRFSATRKMILLK